LTEFTLSQFIDKSGNVKQIILICLTSEANQTKKREVAPAKENALKEMSG
jgi:hypothetical protein